MTPTNKHVTLRMRLRPIRLAFLVPPDDPGAIRNAIEANTCLWGGRFNPLVPVFNRVPSWWDRSRSKRESATSILNGYLSGFEPDYVVETVPGLGAALSLSDDKILSLEDVIKEGREEPIEYGVNAFEIYKHRYQAELQFVRRHPEKHIAPSSPGPGFSLWTAATFGAFPSLDGLRYIQAAYQDAFEPTTTSVSGTNLLEHVRQSGNALKAGSSELEVRRLGYRATDPVIFLHDPSQPRDVVDFWNLRALGWRVIPLPLQWADEARDSIETFVSGNNAPFRDNPSLRRTTTLLTSRSIAHTDTQRFAERLNITGHRALTLQHWYPRLWNTDARGYDRAVRCELIAEEDTRQSEVVSRHIEFAAPDPKFASRHSAASSPRWAVVVQIHDYSPGSEFAAVIPPGLRDLDQILSTSNLRTVTANSEGIVLRSRYKNWTHRWRLPDGVEVFKAWLKCRELHGDLSGAGKIALQIFRKLEGNLHPISHPDILRTLDRMSHGLAESRIDEDEAPKKTRIRGSSVPAKTWLDMLRRTTGNNAARAQMTLETLTQRGVLRLGLRVQCPECAQGNWYPLGKLSDELQCERCLSSFRFPTAESLPRTDAWAYRTQGAFSIENYAQGSYTVVLALRFFNRSYASESTWAPNLEIAGPNVTPLEIDFGVWWRESKWNPLPPTLILGECKSFGESFGKAEIARAKRLSVLFPGAVLVFATLREELKPDEKRLLGKLALRGRRHLTPTAWKNPVMVLTAHELMSPWGAPSCWREAGGRFAAFADRNHGPFDIQQLSRATQQLHLGLEQESTPDS